MSLWTRYVDATMADGLPALKKIHRVWNARLYRLPNVWISFWGIPAPDWWKDHINSLKPGARSLDTATPGQPPPAGPPLPSSRGQEVR